MNDSESVGAVQRPLPRKTDESENQQPEYGQRRVPEYGAMANQFPANYNPYVFGAPEPEKDEKSKESKADQQNTSFANPFSRQGHLNGRNGGSGKPDRSSRQPQSGQNQPRNNSVPPVWPSYNGRQSSFNPNYGNIANRQGAPQNDQHQPDMVGDIDMNDPQQNPLWGHWSALAIASFILSLCSSFEFSLLWLIMGIVSIRRTKVYHMRGRGLAVAAVVISIFCLLLQLWLLLHPDAMQGLLDSLYSMAGGLGSGYSGGNPLSA